MSYLPASAANESGLIANLSTKATSLTNATSTGSLTFAGISGTLYLNISTFGPFPRDFPSASVYKVVPTAAAISGASLSTIASSVDNRSRYYFTATVGGLNETLNIVQLNVVSVVNNPSDPISTSFAITEWEFFQTSDYLEQSLSLGSTFTTARASLSLSVTPSIVYNSNIVPLKQALFSTGSYVVIDGFPYDASGIEQTLDTGDAYVTSGLSVISYAATKVLSYTSDSNYLSYNDSSNTLPSSTFSSSNRWVAQSGYSSGSWSSYSGTARSLSTVTGRYPAATISNEIVLNDTEYGFPTVPLFNGDFLYTTYTPWNLNSDTTFTALAVVMPDAAGQDTLYQNGVDTGFDVDKDWSTIFSIGYMTNSTTPTIYKDSDNRMTVRWYQNGIVSLNYGESKLASLKTNFFIGKMQPLVVGFSLDYGNKRVRLIVADGTVHLSKFASYSPRTGTDLVGSTANLFVGISPTYLAGNDSLTSNPYSVDCSSDMYVYDILGYYQPLSVLTDGAIKNEIAKLDRIYGVLTQ